MPPRIFSIGLFGLFLSLFAASVVKADLDAGRGGFVIKGSEKLLTYAGETLLPTLEVKLQQLSIPGINGDKDSFDYSVSNIKIKAFNASSALTFVPGMGIRLLLQGISLSGGASWSYREKVWPHLPKGDGSLELSTSGSHANATLLLSARAGSLAVTVEDLAIDIQNFRIKVHGSIFSWLYDLIVKAFNSKVKGLVANAIRDCVKDEVDDALNKVFAGIGTVKQLPLPAPFNFAEIDFSVMQATTDLDSLDLTLRGAVNDSRKLIQNYTRRPSALGVVSKDAFQTHHFSFLLSSYVVNSALFIYDAASLFSYLVTPAMVSDKLPGFALNTDALAGLVPGLKRWPHTNITIDIHAASTPTMAIKGNKTAGLTAIASFDFFVNGVKSSVFTLQCPLLAEAQLQIAQLSNVSQSLIINLAEMSCSPVFVNATTVGKVDVDNFQGLISLIMKELLPIVNGLLGKGFPLPSFDDVNIVRTSLVSSNDTIQVSTDIVFSG